jgi:YfiH family protein
MSKFKELTHFCSTRFGGYSIGNYGAFNLSPFTGDVPRNYQQNLQKLLHRFDIDQSRLIYPFQTHGAVVKAIDESFFNYSAQERVALLNGVDALVTNLPKLCVAVTTADCVPILLYDSKQRVVAAIHAGWRGTCARIVEKTIDLMKLNYGTNPIDVIASIGVSISPDAYKVGEELVTEFENHHFESSIIFKHTRQGLYLDLWAANKWLLEGCGVPSDHIEIAGICSFAQSDQFFSARKLGIQSGRMLSGIMINET